MRFTRFFVLSSLSLLLVIQESFAQPNSRSVFNQVNGAVSISESFDVERSGTTFTCGGPIRRRFEPGTVLENGLFLTLRRELSNLQALHRKALRSERKTVAGAIAKLNRKIRRSRGVCNSRPAPSATPTITPPPGTGPNDGASDSGASAQRWSDPSTWPSSSVPSTGQRVTIPQGKRILLDESTAPLGMLNIEGTLEILDSGEPITLTAENILVTGRGHLIAGSTARPYQSKLTIVLTGDDMKATHMGTRTLMAMGGGTVDLIGAAPQRTWSYLGRTINKGESSLLLDERADWKVGDTIIVTTTDYFANQTELRTITAIQDRTITVDRPFNFLHFGEMQYFDNDFNYCSLSTVPCATIQDGIPRDLDERAEVAVLSRNIKIESDGRNKLGQGKDPNRFGGHIMIMGNSIGRFDGIEMFKMGQFGEMGRYPIHWHNVNDYGKHSFIKRSSAHHNFNRCMTVHKSNYVLLEENVGYDTIGHCFFLEDGKEIRNVFRRNLAANVKKGILLSLDNGVDLGSNSDDTPSGFWISNPNNDFIDNAAAGIEHGGNGYWFDIPHTPPPGTISEDSSYHPGDEPFGIFEGNRAHSIEMGPVHGPTWGLKVSTRYHKRKNPAPNQDLFYTGSINQPPLVENFTSFKTFQISNLEFGLLAGGQQGVISNSRFVGAPFSNSGYAVMVNSLATISSKNPTTSSTHVYPSFRYRIPATSSYDGFARVHNSAYIGYEGIFSVAGKGHCLGCKYRNTTLSSDFIITLPENGQNNLTVVFPDADDAFDNGVKGVKDRGTFTNRPWLISSQCKGSDRIEGSGRGARGIPNDSELLFWCPHEVAHVTMGYRQDIHGFTSQTEEMPIRDVNWGGYLSELFVADKITRFYQFKNASDNNAIADITVSHNIRHIADSDAFKFPLPNSIKFIASLPLPDKLQSVTVQRLNSSRQDLYPHFVTSSEELPISSAGSLQEFVSTEGNGWYFGSDPVLNEQRLFIKVDYANGRTKLLLNYTQ